MCEGGNFNGPKGGKYYIINMKKTERSSGYDNFRKSRPVFTKKRSMNYQRLNQLKDACKTNTSLKPISMDGLKKKNDGSELHKRT